MKLSAAIALIATASAVKLYDEEALAASLSDADTPGELDDHQIR